MLRMLSLFPERENSWERFEEVLEDSTQIAFDKRLRVIGHVKPVTKGPEWKEGG